MFISKKMSIGIASVIVLSMFLTPFVAVGILCTMWCIHLAAKNDKVDMALNIILLLLVNVPGIILAFIIYFLGNAIMQMVDDEKKHVVKH